MAQCDSGDHDLRFQPIVLRAALMWSNGFDFFDVPILSTEELYRTEDGEIVFHDWGTGDVTADRPVEGAIIYRGHGASDVDELLV